MIVLKRDRFDIAGALRRSFELNGLSTVNGVSGELFKIAVDLLEQDYLNIYELAKNTRIDTADDSFLDNYGLLLDEPRQTEQFLQVNTLDKVRIYFANPNNVNDTIRGDMVTIDGNPLFIKKGTIILNNTGVPTLMITESVRLETNSVFVKVSALDSNTSFIPLKSLGAVEIDLLNDPNVDPNLLGPYRLYAENIDSLSKPISLASEEDYRFILYSKAKSINLFNEDKLNTILDNPNVLRIIVEKSNPSASALTVYIETKNIDLDTLIIKEVESQLYRIVPFGTKITVRTPVYSYLYLSLRVSANPESDELQERENFRLSLINEINNLRMGQEFSLIGLIQGLKESNPNILNVSIDQILINKRKTENTFIKLKPLEKIIASINTITYKI